MIFIINLLKTQNTLRYPTNKNETAKYYKTRCDLKQSEPLRKSNKRRGISELGRQVHFLLGRKLELNQERQIEYLA